MTPAEWLVRRNSIIPPESPHCPRRVTKRFGAVLGKQDRLRVADSLRRLSEQCESNGRFLAEAGEYEVADAWLEHAKVIRRGVARELLGREIKTPPARPHVGTGPANRIASDGLPTAQAAAARTDTLPSSPSCGNAKSCRSNEVNQ